MIAAPPPPKSRPASSLVVSDEILELERNPKLSSSELGKLAEQLAVAETRDEADRLRDAIMRGFYGTR